MRSWAIALVLVAGLGAQQRLPLPDAAARAAVQTEVLDVLASVMVQASPGPLASDRLLVVAAEPVRSSALRYELLEQAQRCAHAASDIAAGLRVAAAMEGTFAVAGVRDACLARFEAEARVPVQTIVGAYLDAALQTLEGDAMSFAATLARARRLAVTDEPLGLRVHAEEAATDLEAMRRAYERMCSAPGDAALGRRYRALYRGDWQAALADPGNGEDRMARTLRSKITARGEPHDLVALAHAGEQWLSECQHEREAVVQRNLHRRAMRLLLPMALVDTEDVVAGDGEPATEHFEADEIERVRRLLDQATAQAVTASVGSLRFASAADLERLLIVGGAWRVFGGRLFGRSLGPDVATRATTKFAFGRIDCVTVRGGIQSGDGLNLRIATGSVNILFNWEVADQNHFYFGDAWQMTAPRLLQAGREHTIELRQLDETVVVRVDGQQVATGPGHLDGPVTVYPALGSEIFVRAIDVVGDVDVGKVVTGAGTAR